MERLSNSVTTSQRSDMEKLVITDTLNRVASIILYRQDYITSCMAVTHNKKSLYPRSPVVFSLAEKYGYFTKSSKSTKCDPHNNAMSFNLQYWQQ